MKVKDMNVMRIPISKIKLGRNSRTSISYEELDGMMQSIKELGLLQPIGVVRKGLNYEVCYGNRRFLAASKLGWSSIPAVVWDMNHGFEIDLKNITENVQRRNLSLNEIGRYIELMTGEGLSRKEAAIKMGVSTKYLTDAVHTYKGVPENYRDDVEIRNRPKKGHAPEVGKLSMKQAGAIAQASKRYKLNEEQQQDLFKAAKLHGTKFKPERVKQYATNVLHGKDPFSDQVDHKDVSVLFHLTIKEYERLTKQYVENGPFNSIGPLFKAILKGEIMERISIITPHSHK